MVTGTQDTETPPAPRLLDQIRDRMRFRHYSIRTEQAYVDWIKRFIRFHGKRHPTTMGAAEVERFLTDLAVVHNVSASTQNQAQSALLFLYERRAIIVRDGKGGKDRVTVLPAALLTPCGNN